MARFPARPWVWIIDAADSPTPLNELPALTQSLAEQGTHFVVIRCGQLCDPPEKYADMMLVEGNVLTRRQPFRAVTLAAGRTREEEQAPLSSKQQVVLEPPTRDEAVRIGRLLLVAEDNETNQMVILRQLEILGFAADLASNGRLTLERWHWASCVMRWKRPA